MGCYRHIWCVYRLYSRQAETHLDRPLRHRCLCKFFCLVWCLICHILVSINTCASRRVIWLEPYYTGTCLHRCLTKSVMDPTSTCLRRCQRLECMAYHPSLCQNLELHGRIDDGLLWCLISLALDFRRLASLKSGVTCILARSWGPCQHSLMYRCFICISPALPGWRENWHIW